MSQTNDESEVIDIEGLSLRDIANVEQMPVISLDMRLTRRTTVHCLAMPDDTELYSAVNVVDLLKIMDDYDVRSALMIAWDSADEASQCYVTFTNHKPEVDNNG